MATIESVIDNDLIQGTPGEDNSIESWGFRSTVVGADGDDTLKVGTYLGVGEGGDGDDYLYALRSYVTLDGGSGHDIVEVNTKSWNENIANVSLYGGAGDDLFVFSVGYIQDTLADGSIYNDWRNILGSTIMDFNAEEGDWILLQNIGSDDYSNPYAFNLYMYRSVSGDLMFTDFNSRINFTMSGVTRFSDIAQTHVGFNDVDSGSRVTTRLFANVVPFVDMGEGVKMLNDWLVLESTIEGDVQLSDDAFRIIDAVEDSVAGRALIGNSSNNWIYAGAYGNKLWGNSGSVNYLIGGEGSDTFYAGAGEGTVYVNKCSDDDVLKLWNINAGDLSKVSFDTFEGYEPTGAASYQDVNILTNDQSLIRVVRSDDASVLTVQLADGGTFRFHYDDNYWEQINYDYISPLETIDAADGLMIFMNTAVIGSSYDGDVRLADFDSSINNISAVNDTVEGRVLTGDDQKNVIRAGSGGASISGGGGFADTLYGGAGNDTFVMSKNEGGTQIRNCSTDDVVLLYDATFDDINSLSKSGTSITRTLDVILGKPSITGFVEAVSPIDAESTTFLFGDGSTLRYYNPDNEWQLSYDGLDWNTITEVNGMPVGMSTLASVVYLSSDYPELVFALDDLNNSLLTNIDAGVDNMVGRTLIGDTQDNSILAGFGGVWLWGGEGGNDTLEGGDGADTYQAGLNEGNLRVSDYSSEDVVYLYDCNFSDIVDLYVEINDYNTFVIGNAGEDFYFVIQSPTANLQTTTFQFADGSGMRYDPSENIWQRSTNGSTWSTFDEVNGSPVGTFVNSDGIVYVMSDYVGDFSLADYDNGTLTSVSGYYILDESRKISGNELDNRVRGSNFVGSWLYGADGDDTLVGGNGVDTFEARQGEGNTHILYYSSDDVVWLSNVDFSDIKYLARYADDNYWCPLVTTNDGTNLEIWSNTLDDTSTTLLLADNSTLRHDVAANVWQRSTNGLTWSTITEVNGNPVGIYEADNVLFLNADYQSNDFSLADFDGAFASVSADRDTLYGRKISGDANDNRIRASRSASNWLWGGSGGDDTLIGGAGDDTFQAGMGEGTTHISLAASNDLIYLSNVNYSDLKFLSNTADASERITRITMSDDSIVFVSSALEESSTTVLLADNSTLRYDAAANSWQLNNGSSQQTLTSINGTPVGVETYSLLADVFSDYVGNFDLNDLNDSSVTVVDAGFDTLSGRVIIGDDQNNYIFANDYGSSIYGGAGYDTLIGGDGDDTFRTGMGEGDAVIGNYSSNDLVDLWNINFEDIGSLCVIALSSQRRPIVTTNDGTNIVVWTELEEATTNFMLADGSKLRYDATDNTWQRNTTFGDTWTSIDSVYDGTPVGLFNDGEGMLYVYSDYRGDVELSALGDDSITNVYAVNDTLSGRLIVGDENDNMIMAGSGGASIWGGTGGSDYLIGGAGADTFVAGLNEGTTDIIDCADNDLVILHNISSYDVLVGNTVDMIVQNTDSGTTISISTSDLTVCNVWYGDDVTETNFLLSDGIRFKYDYEDQSWQTIYESTNDELAALLSIDLNELTAVGSDSALDGSEFDEPLNDDSSLIMKYAKELHRRKYDYTKPKEV